MFTLIGKFKCEDELENLNVKTTFVSIQSAV